MDIKIKTFRIQSAEDEQSLNDFLAGKIVRHWGTTFDGGAWNVFLGYEIRVNENRRVGTSPNHRDMPMRPERMPERRREEKPPKEDYIPQITQQDQPLFEAIRKWRNARAREERVKPFILFNNKQLESIVNSKPASTDALRSLVSDMEPTLWEKYQNELLGFLDAATNHNHQVVGAASEVAA